MARQERGQLQTSLIGGNPLLSLLAPNLKPIATQWFYGGPSVVDVDGDQDIEHGQTGVVVTGHDFGDTQGAGLVRIGDGPDFGTANLVAQTVTAWADGAITITVSLGAQDPGPKWLYVTTNAGETSVGRPIWVHRGTAFTLHPSANIGAGAVDTTTARLTAPTGTFVAGTRSDDTNPLPVEAFAADGYTEWELSVIATTRAVPGEDYEFRVVGLADDGTVVPLDDYTVLATWSVPAGGPVSLDLGPATEVDTAGAVAATKALALGPATDTETAGAARITKALTAATATEADTAGSARIAKALAAGPATEVDTAGAATVSTATSLALGAASETDTAGAARIVKAVPLAAATSTETAGAAKVVKALAAGVAATVDEAASIPLIKLLALGAATETDAAGTATIATAGPLVLGPALEIDTAGAARITKALPLAATTEADTAGPARVAKLLALGPALELDSAGVATVATAGQLPLGPAVETDTAGAVRITKTVRLVGVIEVDAAGTVVVSTAGAGWAWLVSRGGTLRPHQALLDGVHPATAEVT